MHRRVRIQDSEKQDHQKAYICKNCGQPSFTHEDGVDVVGICYELRGQDETAWTPQGTAGPGETVQ